MLNGTKDFTKLNQSPLLDDLKLTSRIKYLGQLAPDTPMAIWGNVFFHCKISQRAIRLEIRQFVSETTDKDVNKCHIFRLVSTKISEVAGKDVPRATLHAHECTARGEAFDCFRSCASPYTITFLNGCILPRSFYI